MYKDIELKLEYYRNRIINSIIDKRIYPSEELINEKLKDIDLSMAIFKNDVKAIEGKKFNVEDINYKALSILQDIKYLYQLILDINYKEIRKFNSYCATKTLELENKTKEILNRSYIETNTTSLGKTIAKINSPFIFKKNNSQTVINIGVCDITKGSSIVGLIDGNNYKDKNIKFKLSNPNNELLLIPYSINKDIVNIPGENKIKTLKLDLSPSDYNSEYLIIDESNNDYIYKCFLGKNKIMAKNINYNTDNKIIEIDNYKDIFLSDESNGTYVVEFYTVDATAINFSFNKKPISANFPLTNEPITGLNKIQRFVFQVDNDTAFKCQIDNGNIYADIENGIIKENGVFIKNKNGLSDVDIDIYDISQKEKYNIDLVIEDDNNDVEIETIIIKELIKVGE